MPASNWIVYALLSGLFMAIVNLIDKYILTKWIKQPMVPILMMGVIGFVWSLIIYFVQGFSFLSQTNILLTFLAGISFLFMAYFYFRAAMIEEISRVVPLNYIAPFFVSIQALVFLDESFSAKKYIGILFLILGAFLISLKKPFKLHVGKAFWLMILSSFALSIHLVITKYLLSFADFWTVFSLSRIGLFLALLPVFPKYYSDFVSTLKNHGRKVVVAMTVNESFALLASLFITIAASSGFVTLVNALSSVQPFFVLFFAVVLSIFFPKVLKEEIGKSVILLKFVAMALMFTGAVLIT